MDPIHLKTRLTLQVLGGYENIRVLFRVLISDYFWIRVGVGSASGHIYPTSEPDFFFFLKKTLLFVGQILSAKQKMENEKASGL